MVHIFRYNGPLMARARFLAAMLCGISILVSSEWALACKDRIYPPSLPKAEYERFAHIYVVDVVSVVPTGPRGRYAAPFELKARVVSVFKGLLAGGTDLVARTETGVEAQARCPIELKVGRYLIFLHEESGTLIIPRYDSLYLGASDKHFARYVKDLELFSSR
jgi:hypothetical protein